MALGLYLTVNVRVVAAGLAVEVSGHGADQVPRDEAHLVVRAFRAACAMLDLHPPGLFVHCANGIPLARGLGSSAAAVVAGIAAAFGLADQPMDERALRLAAEYEGHADNAAASLYGGLAIAWREAAVNADQAPRYRSIRFEPYRDLFATALIPAGESFTQTTRSLLPAQVPHEDAAFAVSRAALIVPAITSQPELLLPATADRLHQDYREPAWPSTIRVIRALRSCGVAAFVSGAGPTVLALSSVQVDLPAQVDVSGFEVKRLEIDRVGVRMTPIR